MNISVVLLGVALLVALVVLTVRADVVARDNAWKGITARRRAIWEEHWQIAEYADALTQEAGRCPCQGCRQVRRLFDQITNPQDPV